jgi:PAS domain-containing protein
VCSSDLALFFTTDGQSGAHDRFGGADAALKNLAAPLGWAIRQRTPGDQHGCAVQFSDCADISVKWRMPGSSRTRKGNSAMLALQRPGLPSQRDIPSTEPLLHAEEVLQALFDSVGCGILLFGASGGLWDVNERFSEILQIEVSQLRKVPNFDSMVALLAPQFADSTALAERWRETFQKGEPSWDEMELLRPERKVLERFARPVWGGHKERLGWLEIYRDITGHRMIESRLFHTDRLAALGQLVSGIAHELNNPLTSILGYAQLLLRREGSWSGNADAKRILEEAERASRIQQEPVTVCPRKQARKNCGRPE